MDVQIWDDLPNTPSPEALNRTREWFDKMVAEGRVRVLTWRFKDGSVTFIEKGDAQLRSENE